MSVSARNSAYVGLLCVALALVVFGSSAPVEAQQAGKSYRLGYLTPFPIPPTEVQPFSAAYKLFEKTCPSGRAA